MSELGDAIDRWTAAGLISAEQAQRIRTAEGLPAASTPQVAPRQRRVPLLAEALGYLGASLALVAIALLIGRLWNDLDDWAQVALPAFGALVLLAAGFVAGTSDEPALRRLRSFLWFLSPCALVASAGLYGSQVADFAVDGTALLCSVIALVYTVSLWIKSRSALQHLLAFSAVVATAVTLLERLDHVEIPYFGLLVWAVGLAWVCLSWGEVVQPEWAGFALGSIALLVGPNIFAIEELRAVGLGLGLLTAAGLIAAAVVLRLTLLLWFGAAGVFIFVPQATFEFFGDTFGAPVALLISGMVVLGTGLVVPRLRGLTKAEPDEA